VRLTIAISFIMLLLVSCTYSKYGYIYNKIKGERSNSNGIIKGTVFDRENKCVPDVEIMIQRTNFKAVTDSTGTYVFNNIPADYYTLEIVDYKKYITRTRDFSYSYLPINVEVKPFCIVSNVNFKIIKLSNWVENNRINGNIFQGVCKR